MNCSPSFIPKFMSRQRQHHASLFFPSLRSAGLCNESPLEPCFYVLSLGPQCQKHPWPTY